MPMTYARVSFALFLVAVLSACGSATLIELNNDFARLSEQAANAERQLRDDDLSDIEFATLIEVNRLSFAQNGNRAVVAAEEASSPQSRASFINLAVRSYLNSGPVADDRIPDLVEQGTSVCKAPELQGLNALPVTCGYFHIVTPQAINNEAQRTLEALARKAIANRDSAEDGPLSADDGIALRGAFDLFIGQISEIDQASTKGDLASVDPRFKDAIARQKLIFFCNAVDAFVRYDDVVPTGPEWDRNVAIADSARDLRQAEARLGITSRNDACSG